MSAVKKSPPSPRTHNVPTRAGKRQEGDPSRRKPHKKQQQQHPQHQQQLQRRRGPAGAAVSLESFAQRRGHVRALEEFKKRRQVHRVETAKALRKYRKVMQQEGMEAGRGASRKRQMRPGEGGGDDGPLGEPFGASTGRGVDEGKVGEATETRTPISQREKRRKVGEEKATLSVENRPPAMESGDDDDDADDTPAEESKEQSVATDRRKRRLKSNPLQKSLEKAKTSKAKADAAKLEREAQEKLRKKKLIERQRRSRLLQKRTKKGQPIMKHTVDNLLLKLMKQQQEG